MAKSTGAYGHGMWMPLIDKGNQLTLMASLHGGHSSAQVACAEYEPQSVMKLLLQGRQNQCLRVLGYGEY